MCSLINLAHHSHVIRAAQNPVLLDECQVKAVGARIEIDLRLGAIFTRFQTLTLQTLGGDLQERVISYGLYHREAQICGLATILTGVKGLVNFQLLALSLTGIFECKNLCPKNFGALELCNVGMMLMSLSRGNAIGFLTAWLWSFSLKDVWWLE